MTPGGRFVVGTGRCGSTLLSRMLRCHPDVLELSEFFNGLDWNKRFADVEISGDEFRDLLSQPQPFIRMALERGYVPEEVTYPFDQPGARFTTQDPLPWILAATLPPLSQDPDDLFDEVCNFARNAPRRRPAAHAHALFDWLCERLHRTVWVERSAAAISFIGDLAREFPGSRFLHLHRSGEDTARSMREHPVFRLAVMLTYKIPIGAGGGSDELSELGNDADHVSRLLATRPPLEYFGRWWCEQIVAGSKQLKEIPADDHQELRFEDLISAPRETLARVATHLELPHADLVWTERAAALAQRGTAAPSDRTASMVLADVCRDGNRLLGRC